MIQKPAINSRTHVKLRQLHWRMLQTVKKQKIPFEKDWQSFKIFERWALANGCDRLSSLLRKDSKKGFIKENVYFAPCAGKHGRTYFVKDPKQIVIRGVSKTVPQWATVYGINEHLIYVRLKRGWKGTPVIMKKNVCIAEIIDAAKEDALWELENSKKWELKDLKGKKVVLQ